MSNALNLLPKKLLLMPVTSSVGIRNHEKRVTDMVVRELKRAKPDAWGSYRLVKCGQLRRRLTCGLDTFGSASLGRFLVA